MDNLSHKDEARKAGLAIKGRISSPRVSFDFCENDCSSLSSILGRDSSLEIIKRLANAVSIYLTDEKLFAARKTGSERKRELVELANIFEDAEQGLRLLLDSGLIKALKYPNLNPQNKDEIVQALLEEVHENGFLEYRDDACIRRPFSDVEWNEVEQRMKPGFESIHSEIIDGLSNCYILLSQLQVYKSGIEGALTTKKQIEKKPLDGKRKRLGMAVANILADYGIPIVARRNSVFEGVLGIVWIAIVGSNAEQDSQDFKAAIDKWARQVIKERAKLPHKSC